MSTPVTRALLSVSDKQGLVDLARFLLGEEIVPVGVTPTTSTVIRLRRGEDEEQPEKIQANERPVDGDGDREKQDVVEAGERHAGADPSTRRGTGTLPRSGGFLGFLRLNGGRGRLG